MNQNLRANSNWRDDLRQIIFPEKQYSLRKLEDHRFQFILLNTIAALFGVLMWSWDYVIDPVGARETLILRLFFLLMLANALGAWRRVPLPLLKITVFCTSVFGVLLFIAILLRLHNGMLYSIGGFMFFMLTGLVLFHGLSAWFVTMIASTVAALPHLVALMGWVPNFPHLQYAILIWPAACMVASALFSSELDYLKRYHSERALEFDSTHDHLSGAWNRRFFIPLLRREMLNRRRTRSEVCLIMLDIDHFKHVNDTYGHPTGDTVICKITEICQQTLMRTSDVFARFGGEEFVVMLPGADIDSAILVAEKLRAAIEDCAFYDNQGVQFRVTVSLGVACSMAGDVDEVPMLARADAALYQAKKGGRNCVR